MEEGALLEPLNVAVHACRRAKVSIGQSVLVCGAGPIGVLNIITAKAMGAAQVLVTDIDDARLALAKRFGANHILNATQVGGVIMLVGASSDRADLPVTEASTKELDIRGVLRYANCYPTALDMVAKGVVDLKGLTTAHYKLEDSLEAFKRAQKGDVLKVFINCYD
uniref:Alcohol dehydrogenase-like C-terminal domain-containing protein n=1 Tax=Ditylenchus dipsaci TaxID=166011 RepID=A0A915DPW1_9BILA